MHSTTLPSVQNAKWAFFRCEPYVLKKSPVFHLAENNIKQTSEKGSGDLAKKLPPVMSLFTKAIYCISLDSLTYIPLQFLD